MPTLSYFPRASAGENGPRPPRDPAGTVGTTANSSAAVGFHGQLRPEQFWNSGMREENEAEDAGREKERGGARLDLFLGRVPDGRVQELGAVPANEKQVGGISMNESEEVARLTLGRMPAAERAMPGREEKLDDVEGKKEREKPGLISMSVSDNGADQQLQGMAAHRKKMEGLDIIKTNELGEIGLILENQNAHTLLAGEERIAREKSANIAKDTGGAKRPTKTFSDRVAELRAFRAKHGHVNVTTKQDPQLSQFCRNCRHARKNPGSKVKLTEARAASLDELGFDWRRRRANPKSVTKKSFAERIEDLVEYKRDHGHLNVKRNENQSLRDFCANARTSRKHQKLSQDRIASLDAIGFDWKLEPQYMNIKDDSSIRSAGNDVIQHSGYDNLGASIQQLDANADTVNRLDERHGSKCEPFSRKISEYPSEPKSVDGRKECEEYKTQRGAKQPVSDAAASAKSGLQLGGVLFNKVGSAGRKAFRGRYKSFSERLADLRVHKEKYGHCDVNVHHDYSLSQFCSAARYARRNLGKSGVRMKLTEDRIASLDALGFDWRPGQGYNSLLRENGNEAKIIPANGPGKME